MRKLENFTPRCFISLLFNASWDVIAIVLFCCLQDYKDFKDFVWALEVFCVIIVLIFKNTMKKLFVLILDMLFY